MKESDLYEPVKKWLEQNGYSVFSEVSPRYSSRRVDVVGVNPESVAVVELKLSLSLDLLDQAVNWSNRKYANYIFIAVPWNRKGSPRIDNDLVRYICDQFKIGVLFVQKDKNELYINDKPYMKAKYIKVNNKELNFRETIEQFKQEYINSELKGGHSGGGYITQYRVTIERVKELLKKVRLGKSFSLWWYEDGKLIDIRDNAVDGWIDINTILAYCETHYASPKPSLSKALREFEHDWCESQKIGRKLHFRYKTE
ncbi:hypothetical protein A616_16595 [Brevibacillus brevis X23]|nr:hypothetical protein A616_16595 [Brevibacillus brevis X23]